MYTFGMDRDDEKPMLPDAGPPSPRRKSKRRRFPTNSHYSLDGENISAEENEFLMAMDRFKREKCRPFPTWREVLAVLKSLGYRKDPAG
jgi:hypothetical protein